MTESHDPADLQAEVYATHSTEYDRLVSAEDVDDNLAPAIVGDADASGLTVVEAGAGTGRITRLLEGRGAFVAASDLSHAMLATEALLVPVSPCPSNRCAAVADRSH